MEKILIVDDDIHIGNVLEESLQGAGYGTVRAYSGTEALLSFEREKPDLVLLDLMLPGLSGEELLPKIKDVPVIVISAKIGVDDKVNTLLGGAVDYITKPFQIKEVMARISVRLRKEQPRNDGELCFSGITLDLNSRTAKINEKEIRLTRTEFAILKLLMLNPTQVITKSQLLDRISEDTPDCTESSLKTHISHLRSKLREVGGREYIEAVWGIGFKMK